MHTTLTSGIIAGLFTLAAAAAGPEGPAVRPGDEAFIGPAPMQAEPRREVRASEPHVPEVKAPEVRTPAVKAAEPRPEVKPEVRPETRPAAEDSTLRAPAVREQSAPLGKPAAKAEGEAAAVAGSGAGGVGGVGMTRTILALAAVLALIVLAAGVFRKVAARTGGLAAAMGAAGRAPSGILAILGRYPLDRSTTLVLLKVDRRVLLLAQTRGGARLSGATVSTLCEMTGQDEVASIMAKCAAAEGGSPARKFQKALEEADGVEEDEPAPRKGSGAEALAAVIQAALQQGRQAAAKSAAAPAAAPAPAPAPRAAVRTAGPDAAAELRKRLAAMRAKSALDLGGRARTEVVA